MNAIRELVTVLRYQVDQSGLRKYQTAYREAIGKIGAGVRNVRDFGLGFVDGVRQGIGEVMVSQRALNAAQAQGTREVQQMGQGYRSIAGVVRSIVAGVSVISAARIADEWASVEGRVALVTDGVEEQQRALKELYRISQDSGQEYGATAGLFQSVQRNRKELDLTLDKSLELSGVIGKFMTIGGGSAASQQAALVQLGQALGTGTLRGEELNSVMEQAPRLAQAIAEAFGVPVGQLKKLGEQGKLSSKVLAEGLLRQAEKANEEFGRMPMTFARAWTRLTNALGKQIDQLNKSSRAANIFYALTSLLIDNLGDILKLLALIGASYGLVRLRAALIGATQATTLLQAAMIRLRALSLAALWPYLRMAALLTSLYLIGEDILVWMRGGVSVTGGLIGRVEEWQEWIDRIRDGLAWIKDQLGGLNDELGPWLRKWGTIGVLILGLSGPLFRVLQLMFTLGKGLLFLGRGFGLVLRLAWMLVAGLAAVVGWPALLVAAVVAAVAAAGVAIYKHWDDIKKWGADAWDSITAGAGAAYDSIVAWIKGIGESISTWITGKLEEAKSMFSNLAPDWLKTGASWVGRNVLGVGAADVQRAGATKASVTVQNNVGGVTVNAPNANPASVAAATQRGVSGALAGARASTAGVAVPMVEAMP
ncbi:tape measure protein [Cupriavidus sp. DB3]|uniref:tape measure protein n=1 Tax=Cupriavidus sp. DB3 TaxID=2873259 RepID=UPI001CF29EBB|nr:tape measure protein [Cupriavidus sp. DB3]MCA7086047.1 tape measure protein [Cupriavidus sp. DB3]